MTLNRRALSVAAALAVVGTLAAGCGSDSNGGGDSGSARAESGTAKAPAGEPIKLYNIAPLTGPAQFPWIPDGAKAAAAAINDAGGVQGRPIEILTCDDKFDPNADVACGRQIVKDKAVAVVGSLVAGGDKYVPVLTQAGIPDVAPIPNNPLNLTDDLAFPIVGGTQSVMIAAPQICKNAGATTVRGAYVEVPSAQLSIEKFLPIGLEKAGLSLAGKEGVAITQKDYSPFAASLMRDGTDCIVGAFHAEGAGLLIKALKQAGYKGTLVLEGGAVQPVLPDLGATADGVYLVNSSLPTSATSDPGMKRYLAEMKGIGDDSPKADYLSINAWAAVHLVADLLKDAHTIDSAALVKALRSSGERKYSPAVPFDLSKRSDLYGSDVKLFTNYVVVTRVTGDEAEESMVFDENFVDAAQLPAFPSGGQ